MLMDEIIALFRHDRLHYCGNIQYLQSSAQQHEIMTVNRLDDNFHWDHVK